MRVMYWHLTPNEVLSKPYPVEKLLHWEIRGYFSEASYFSIYWFKHGIPYDKEPIVGIALYTIECSKDVEDSIVEFLHAKYGGEVMRRGYRTFIAFADTARDNNSIARLALELAERFKAVCEIWLEFDGISNEEAKQLYANKAIPIN